MKIDDFVPYRILQLCEKHNINRYALAKKAGISHTALTDAVNKKHQPTIVTLEKICNGFGITLSEFFFRDEDVDHATWLPNEQKEILKLWESLTAQQQDFARFTMENLRDRK